MIQMIFYRIIFSFFFLVATTGSIAQVDPGSIKATVDKNKILIGEPILLTLEIKLSPGTEISPFRLDSIPHFEFLEEPVTDSSNDNGNTIIKTMYTITSFDSGHWVIPSYIMSGQLRTDSIGIDVVFSDFDPNQDYHDIKDIIEVKPKKKIPWWWYAAGGALLLLLAVIYFLRKKKPVIVKKESPAGFLNAYDEAMKELDELQRSKTDPKAFYSKLTGIFRVYVFRRKGILSLQKTTDDLVLQLKGLNITKEQFDKLAQSLRLSDFVKFAKYIPMSNDDTAAFDTIKDSIINIEKSEAQVLPSGRI